MDIGIRIKAHRVQLGLTQDQLGERCGSTKSAVSQWESNTTQPAVDSLIPLAAALGCSIDWLLTGRGIEHLPDSSRTARLVAIFSDLDPRGQDTVLRTAEAEAAYCVKPDMSRPLTEQ